MMEVHTSELVSPCKRAAYLRINGQDQRWAETALVRGLAAHAALEIMCNDPDGSHDPWTTANAGYDATAEKLNDEGRTMTAAPIANRDKICMEIADMLEAYSRRLMPMMESVVGVELPVSMLIEVDGETVRFASHIDLIYVGASPLTGERALCVYDWKWRQDEPSSAYLARNLQIGMYWHAVRAGGVMDHDGWPIEMPDLPIELFWIHLPNLAPYKVTRKGLYEKGDDRPLERVAFRATMNHEANLMAEFSDQVRMMRAGFWPANPEPTRCRICLSSHACRAWSNYGE